MNSPGVGSVTLVSIASKIYICMANEDKENMETTDAMKTKHDAESKDATETKDATKSKDAKDTKPKRKNKNTKATETSSMSKLRYKYCIVPECKSTTIRTPEKLFFSIPNGEKRLQWCELMGRRQPQYKPLSATCNRFCCEDHFNLETDMENYMRWKVMGRKGTRKLMLNKGVVPHIFDCQNHTTTKQVEMKSQVVEDILEKGQQKEVEETLDKKSKVNQNKRKQNRKGKEKEELQEIQKKIKVSEEGKIVEQLKKLERISQITQVTNATSQEQDIETYINTFQIKKEPEADYELNDGILNKVLSQNTVRDNSYLLDVNVKIEALDEEFEPELVEEEIQGNIIEDEPDKTDKTDMKTVLSKNITLVIDKTNSVINEANSVISDDEYKKDDDDLELVFIEEIQEIIEEKTNPDSSKTEIIRVNKVFEQGSTGEEIIYEIIEHETE